MQQCHSIQGLGITRLRNLLTNYTSVNLYIITITNMKTAKDYQQKFRLKNDELAQFDEFLNDPKRTCFHGKECLICKDPDPEGNFIIVGVNFRILPAGTLIVTKDGSII